MSASARLAAADAIQWCILRTSPGQTVALATSLERAGMDVWTPARTLRRRRPRSQKTIEITAPIMPTFVFVRAVHLHQLAIIAALPISPHPRFCLFRHAGRIPLVADREVAGARAEEARAREEEQRLAAKAHRRVFEKGQRVRVNADAFLGLEAIVDDGGDGRAALVTFGGAVQMSIASFLLTPADLDAELPRAA